MVNLQNNALALSTNKYIKIWRPSNDTINNLMDLSLSKEN